MGKHGSGIGNLGVLPSQTQKIDDCRRCFVPPTSCCVYLENPVVERDHHQAGDVEGAEAGPDDEVRVVEGADERLLWILESLSDSQTCVEAQRLIHLTTIIFR